ncbi:CzcE family metal-binding protein [Cupriavidus pauculus]|uniref:CzcE family metal-binding protein n=1 Tax=Cupriavidus pauculus TaxID=82633 RepID=UPI0007841039|nr:CzcE family metal-binding protein [Cupriavidus pauculus]
MTLSRLFVLAYRFGEIAIADSKGYLVMGMSNSRMELIVKFAQTPLAACMPLLFALTSACTSVAPAHANFGRPAAVTSASRTIELGPATKYVQVYSGETVAFHAADKMLGWTFGGNVGQGTIIDMREIFPDLPEAKGIAIYIFPRRMKTHGH